MADLKTKTAGKLPAWLPDWRDPTQYPDPKDTRLGQWAWEFLRRNPKYQADYHRWTAVPGQTWGKPPSKTPLEVWARCDPPPLASETEIQYKSRLIAERKQWLITPLFKVLCEKYGLSPPFLPDPEKNDPGLMFSLITARGPERVEVFDDEDLSHDVVSIDSMTPESISEVVVKVDLNVPIDEQLKRLKVGLKLRQDALNRDGLVTQVRNRNRVNNYRTYLRILDGKACGASIKELADVVFPDHSNTLDTDYGGRKKVENSLGAAKKLRDHNYRYIVLR